jgi:hypothetical protein
MIADAAFSSFLTFSIQQQIVKFQVTINDFVLVEVLQAKNDARSIENCPGFAENISVNVHHEVTTSSVFHDKANVLLLKNFRKISQDSRKLRSILTSVWKHANKLTRNG